MQVVVDRDGTPRTVLEMLVREALAAGIEQVAVVVAPGDKPAYAAAAGNSAAAMVFVEQPQPNGYGDAILCAQEFTDGEAVLHFVGDHLFLSSGQSSCARQIVDLARRESCSVSAVQATREHALPFYGTIGARRVPNAENIYEVENVVEKPTPAQAEQTLLVPGLRAGHYLCFVGMHVLTPGVIRLLRSIHAQRPTLSDALALLPRSERYLALESSETRYNVGVKHGLLMAQLALSGPDRDDILTQLVELLAKKP